MADKTLDTRPEVVNLKCYAGDTLTLTVKVASEFVAGRDWDAQVRTPRTGNEVDATFQIAVADDGFQTTGYLTLPSEVTRDLGSGVVRTRNAKGVPVLRFSGEWDVQLSMAGDDPVTTLAQGSITIDADVTRTP